MRHEILNSSDSQENYTQTRWLQINLDRKEGVKIIAMNFAILPRQFQFDNIEELWTMMSSNAFDLNLAIILISFMDYYYP